MKLNFRKIATFMLVACIMFVCAAVFGQSTVDSTAVGGDTSPVFLDQIKVWITVAILIVTELIGANVKTPFSFSVLTYAVNIMDAILTFIKKIRPDKAMVADDSHYANPLPTKDE